MGAGGSGFAFLELFAAGAQRVIRYGSNDRPSPLSHEALLVSYADGLHALLNRERLAYANFDRD